MAVYGATENTEAELSQLIAREGAILKAITLSASCGDLARGTVLEMVSISSGTWQRMQADGGANARAILAEAVTDSQESQTALAYFVGQYRLDDLIWPDGMTTEQKYTAIVGLQDRGIIIDRPLLSIPTTTTTAP